VPSGEIPIPVDGIDGEHLQVSVYGTPQVGQALGRNEQTVRKWLNAGALPEPAWRGDDLPKGHALRRGRNRRWYTDDEMRILLDHRELLRKPYATLAVSPYFAQVRQELGQLERGLRPERLQVVRDRSPRPEVSYSPDEVAAGVTDFISHRTGVVPHKVDVCSDVVGADATRPACRVYLHPDDGMISSEVIRLVKMMLPDRFQLEMLIYTGE
jgi:hypothetical protein